MTFKFSIFQTGKSPISVDCYPVGIENNGFEYEKEKEKFYFRKKFAEKFTFIDNTHDGITDFTLLKSIENGTHSQFNRYATCLLEGYSDEGENVFIARFELIKANWLNEDRTVEVTCELFDEYREVLTNEGKEYNIWDTERHEVIAKAYSTLKFLLTRSKDGLDNPITGGKDQSKWWVLEENGQSGIIIFQEGYPSFVYILGREEIGAINLTDTRQYKIDNNITLSTSDWFWDDVRNVYYRYPYVSFPDLMVQARIYSYYYDEADNYNQYGWGLTPPEEYDATFAEVGRPYTNSRLRYAGASISSTRGAVSKPTIIEYNFDLANFIEYSEEKNAFAVGYLYYSTDQNEYDIENLYDVTYQARRLDQIIDNLISKATDNQITEYTTEDFPEFESIYLIDPSDFIRNSADEFTTIVKVKFDEFMEDLYLMFRAGWDISDGKLRINKESTYINAEDQVDLTSYEGGKYVEADGNYSYDIGKVLGGFQLRQSAGNTPDFAEVTEDYGLTLIGDEIKIEERTLNIFKTDLPYLLKNSQSIEKNGLIMVFCYDTMRVGYQSQALSGIGVVENSQNGQLSLGNLAYYYWRENKPVQSYTVRTYSDTTTYTANGFLPIKSQQLTFIFGSEIDLYKNIKTNLGSGYIDKLREYFFDNSKEVFLLHS